MRFRVVGSSGGCAPGRSPSSYLFDGGVAVDAGALAAELSLAEQRAIEHVFLTHAHWDHVRDLPFTTINRRPGDEPLVVHGLPATIAAVRAHLMNDDVWFSAFELPSPDTPFVKSVAIAAGETRSCNGYSLTAVPFPHTVPAVGFRVDDGTASVLVCSDTHGAGALGRLPAGGSPLRAVVIEASFPNEAREFAIETGHMTPEMVIEECAPLPDDVHVLVTHMKPGFEERITEEFRALDRPNLRVLRDGDVLEF